MLVLRGRIYYVAPVDPMPFAAGACLERGQIAVDGWTRIKRAIVAPLAVGGMIAAPLAYPCCR